MALKWENQKLILLNQTLLPGEVRYHTLETVEQVHDAIRDMLVRGAPVIGVAAGYGMVLAALTYQGNEEGFSADFEAKAGYLAQARPTAVNLPWAVERMRRKARELAGHPLTEIRRLLEEEAVSIHREDVDINRAIGENLLSLLKEGDTVLTHCNAGVLATADYGTALSVFYVAQEKNFPLKAFADETRPWLQGARLTAFELLENGVDVTLICDNMAAVVMSQGKIDAIITGCDRVAANGDTANKIGTFGVSILAKHFGIPMYIAAPTPTIDMDCPDGAAIPIEERPAKEITHIGGTAIAPAGVKTYNPSFDVTPADHITAIVTEKGIAYPPFTDSLHRLINTK